VTAITRVWPGRSKTRFEKGLPGIAIALPGAGEKIEAAVINQVGRASAGVKGLTGSEIVRQGRQRVVANRRMEHLENRSGCETDAATLVAGPPPDFAGSAWCQDGQQLSDRTCPLLLDLANEAARVLQNRNLARGKQKRIAEIDRQHVRSLNR